MPDSATLAAMARDAQGIGQPLPGGAAPDAAALPSDLLKALKNGQFSVAALLQLIAALTNGQLPGAQPQGEGSAISQAFLGQ